MAKKFKKVRTERDVRNDPRVSEIDFGGWTEEWGKDIWVYLAEGFNNEGASTVHEATWGDVCYKLNDLVIEGEPY
jgi:hypothetical protein|tara:strand:- start:13506 stop:13730 length:225 start_codon:yes stop_codon:yes gene_type:complete